MVCRLLKVAKNGDEGQRGGKGWHKVSSSRSRSGSRRRLS